MQWLQCSLFYLMLAWGSTYDIIWKEIVTVLLFWKMYLQVKKKLIIFKNPNVALTRESAERERDTEKSQSNNWQFFAETDSQTQFLAINREVQVPT